MAGGYLNELNNNCKVVINGSSKQEIACYFREESIKVHSELNLSETTKPLANQSVVEFHGGKPNETEFEICFNTDAVKEITASGQYKESKASDVSKLTSKIQDAMLISENLHRPPIVDVICGSIKLSGIILKTDVAFEKFTKDGMPIKASVKVTLKEWSEKEKKTSLQSPDRSKSRNLTPDQSIWMMAEDEYGDDAEWRIIAKANNIMDPLNIEEGMAIKIPAL